jgi:hypothetical protein
MHKHTLCVAAVLLAITAPISWADDKGECAAGIEMIKAEIAKKPTKRVLDQLQRVLKTAEQEVDEGDWDECVVAVREAKKALPRK